MMMMKVQWVLRKQDLQSFGVSRILRVCICAVLFFCLIYLFSLSAPAVPPRVALVIGNSNYISVPVLPNPANDAQAIGQKLGDIGFDVEVVLDADLVAMRGALSAFAERAQGAETALIFYAGHGLQVDGSNYILPTNAALKRKQDLETAAMGMGELFEAFNHASPDTAVLILDSCRDNPFVGSVGGDQGLASGAASSSTLTFRPNAAGLIIAFAASPGAVAYDGGSGNSPYTTALLQWIDQPGLELATMLRRVRGTVLQLTNGAQVPWVEEALVRDVFLNPGPPRQRSSGPNIETALLERIRGLESHNERNAAETFYDRYLTNASTIGNSKASQKDDQFVREGLIWLSIRNSADPQIFQTYIEEFPSGNFTELARVKLESLQNVAEPEVSVWLDDLGDIPELKSTVERLDKSSLDAEIQSNTADNELSDTESDGQQQVEVSVLTRPSSPTANNSLRTREAERDPPNITEYSDEATSNNLAPSPAIEEQSNKPESGTDVKEMEQAVTVPPSPSELEDRLALNKAERAAVQLLLREAGVYPGSLDADFGRGTRAGIRVFQSELSMPTTGYLNIETLRQLIARIAPRLLKSDVGAKHHKDVHRLAAIAARGPGSDVEVIRVEAINRNETVHKYWREIADEFEAEFPGTLIKINHRPGVRYRVELLSTLGSENPPDILYTWSGGHLDALREAGFARDLTDEMADGWAFEFKPGALRTYTHNGQIHGVPMHLSLVSLYANRKVLQEAGIEIGSLDNWDGFIRAVQQLKASGIVPLAVGAGDLWPVNLYFGQLAQRLGGEAGVQAVMKGEGMGFDSPEFVMAAERLEYLADIEPFQPGYLEMDDGQAVEMLARAEVAMVVTGNWRLQKMRWHWPGGLEAMSQELVQLDFPKVGDRPQSTFTHGGADGFAVAADAPDVAVEFLRRLTSREVQERMVQIAADVPSLSGADLSIEGEFLAAAADKILQSTYHQLYFDQALGPEMGGMLTNAMVQLANGELDAVTIMRELNNSWERVFSDRSAR